MALQTVEVSPVSGGWVVLTSGHCAPLVFLSGGRAEQQARRLAVCFASLGDDVRLAVRDLSDAIVGTFFYEACDAYEASEGRWRAARKAAA
jgi:hypothetical protein